MSPCKWDVNLDHQQYQVPRQFRLVQKLQKTAAAFAALHGDRAKDFQAGFWANRHKHNAAKASLVNRQRHYAARVRKYLRERRIDDANLLRAQLEATIRIGDMLEKIVEVLKCAIDVENVSDSEFSEEQSEMSEDEAEPDSPATIIGD
ncbi:hypothetical protein MMC07_007881 [Pseudocyphellaria aurata]|nr:hypothetical protein [Pseudocyphellaria aurata]